MAIQTPFHRERLFLPRQRHLINPPMTGNAPDTFLNVNRMMKIDEIGKIVQPGPHQRLIRFQTARTGSRIGLPDQICEWHDMQV